VVLRTINKRNGSNNLPNLKLDDENWKVRLIEEEFMKHMWDVEGK
jgi:adenine-specific DNA-methyltransferase